MKPWSNQRYAELLFEATCNDDALIDELHFQMEKEGFDASIDDGMCCNTIGILNFDDSRRKAECIYLNDKDSKWYSINDDYTYTVVDLSLLPAHTMCTIDRWMIKDI